jgi:hypothetical protein
MVEAWPEEIRVPGPHGCYNGLLLEVDGQHIIGDIESNCFCVAIFACKGTTFFVTLGFSCKKSSTFVAANKTKR